MIGCVWVEEMEDEAIEVSDWEVALEEALEGDDEPDDGIDLDSSSSQESSSSSSSYKDNDDDDDDEKEGECQDPINVREKRSRPTLLCKSSDIPGPVFKKTKTIDNASSTLSQKHEFIAKWQ